MEGTFQAAVTQEAAAGRVVTAACSDRSGQITYLSYAWIADTATLYEARAVVTPGPGAVTTAASSLATQGFILTASGLADGSGNIVLVGTRVQGDALARPFIAAQSAVDTQALEQRGYARVAVIVDPTRTNPYTHLGER